MGRGIREVKALVASWFVAVRLAFEPRLELGGIVSTAGAGAGSGTVVVDQWKARRGWVELVIEFDRDGRRGEGEREWSCRRRMHSVGATNWGTCEPQALEVAQEVASDNADDAVFVRPRPLGWGEVS